jgi:hypothetical protein
MLFVDGQVFRPHAAGGVVQAQDTHAGNVDEPTHPSLYARLNDVERGHHVVLVHRVRRMMPRLGDRSGVDHRLIPSPITDQPMGGLSVGEIDPRPPVARTLR